MPFIVFIAVVVIFLFWGVVVSILHVEFTQALLLMLPLMLLICLLGKEVQDIGPVSIYNHKKCGIYWPNVFELVVELWWVAFAFWALVAAALRLSLVLALIAMLMLWLISPFLMSTVKNIRARRDSHDKQ